MMSCLIAAFFVLAKASRSTCSLHRLDDHPAEGSRAFLVPINEPRHVDGVLGFEF
jgi:hypothetical protein